MMVPQIPQKYRAYAYRVLTALSVAVVFYGWLSTEEAVLWLGVAAAVLGNGLASANTRA